MATASTSSMPAAWVKLENSAAVRAARSTGFDLSAPFSPMPALMRTASRISSVCCQCSPGT